MGKSLFDMIKSLSAVQQHSRKVEVCSGIISHSTTSADPGTNNRTILEVNGSGRIIAIVPISTNSNYNGTVVVEVDGKKMVEGTAYYYGSGCAYPFMISQEFNGMLPVYSDHSNQYNHKGLFIPEVSNTHRIFDLDNHTCVLYDPSNPSFYGTRNANGVVPISFDCNSKDAKFNKSLKIMATCTSSSYARLLIVYDLFE